jgi:uncharacterized protein (TIGR03000 family)
MNRTSWKCLLVGLVVAVAVFVATPQADARWWGYCGPCNWGCTYGCYSPCYSCYTPCYSCYSPCYSSCSSCCYGSDWYLGVRPGPVRRAVFGPYRWYRGCGYGCGYGCGCSYGCGYGCYGCGTVVGSPCCTDGTVVGDVTPGTGQYPTPAKKPVAPQMALPPEPGPGGPNENPPPPTPPKTSATSAGNSGVLTVWVPYDAKVTVNGLLTRSTGSRRQFVSYGLRDGLTYRYVVKAEVVRNGQIVEDTRTVSLTAGQITAVAFGFNTTPAEQMASTR